jgi:hypothetical protein
MGGKHGYNMFIEKGFPIIVKYFMKKFKYFKKLIFWKEKKLYIGKFIIDADKDYYRVISLFLGHDLHVNFKPDPVHPKAEIVIGPFTRQVLDRWLDAIRGTGVNFKYFVAEWDKVKDTNYFL